MENTANHIKTASAPSSEYVSYIDIETYLRDPEVKSPANYVKFVFIYLALWMFVFVAFILLDYYSSSRFPDWTSYITNNFIYFWSDINFINLLILLIGPAFVGALILGIAYLLFMVVKAYWLEFRQMSEKIPLIYFTPQKIPCLQKIVDLYGVPAIKIVERVRGNCDDCSNDEQSDKKPSTVGTLLYSLFGYISAAIGAPFAALFSLILSSNNFDIPLEIVILVGIGSMLFPFGIFLLRRSRRLRQFSVEELLELDQRPPVIYLRSFASEELEISMHSQPVEKPNTCRFEEIIADRLGQFGPFIAIGKPGEALPTLGAARAYFKNANWQTGVKGMMRDARLITILLGLTPSLGWEISKTITGGHVEKTLFLLAGKKHVGKTDEAESNKSSTGGWVDYAFGLFSDEEKKGEKQEDPVHVILKDSFRDSPWEEGVNSVDLTNALAMHFSGDGRVVVLRSDFPGRTNYELAIIFACYGMFLHEAEAVSS